MKITFLIPDYRRLAGGLRVVAQYAAHLTRQGHTVTLVSRTNPVLQTWQERIGRVLRGGPTQPPPPGETHFSKLNLHIIDLFSRPRPSQIPNGDIVVATWWETVEWLDDLPAAKGRHVHFVQDHENFPYLPQDRVDAVYRRPVPRIVVASWLADVMREHYGQEVEIAPNGVDIDHFTPGCRRRPERPVIGTLHTRKPRKNFELAIAALRAGHRAQPDLKGRVFGSTARETILPDWIDYEERPIQSRIPGIYRACSAWLFTSETEGFGLPILEAMACGTPVLATRAGAAADLVTPQTGRLLESTPEAFAQAIKEISELPETDWLDLSRAARVMAEANDLRRAAERFETVLGKVASA